MKKKLLTVLVALAMACVGAFCLTACGEAKVELDQTSVTITVGEYKELIAKETSDDAVAFSWVTSDANVVTVKDGVLKGISAGKAKVTVTAINGSGCAVCEVTVVNPSEPVIGAVSLNKTTTTLKVSEYIKLQASSQYVTWTSSNPLIATVVGNGIVVGISTGEAVITATLMNGLGTASCTVTVAPATPVSGSLTLNKTTITLSVGDVEILTASRNDVIWSSDNPLVVVANPTTGEVTGVGAGTATITAITLDGLKSATCAVTVTGSTGGLSPEEELVLNETTLTLSVGEKFILTADEANVVWVSDNPLVVAIDAVTGEVEGISAGTATIMVANSTGSKFATCEVTVTGGTGGLLPEIGELTLNKTTLSLNVDDVFTLTVIGEENVMWVSENPLIADVNPFTGEVTAFAPGTVTIGVISADYARMGSCIVTVS